MHDISSWNFKKTKGSHPMKNFFALLAVTTAMGLVQPAYAIDANAKVKYESKANGGYESKSSSETNANGVATTRDKHIDVDVDADGTTTKNIVSETVNDAKGLLNKQKVTTEVETKKDAAGNYVRKVNAVKKDAAGSNIGSTTKTDVNVDANGNVETETKVEKTIDPKGLFNTTEETATIKLRNGKVIEKTVEKDD
jgi:hypothetical protein